MMPEKKKNSLILKTNKGMEVFASYQIYQEEAACERVRYVLMLLVSRMYSWNSATLLVQFWTNDPRYDREVECTGNIQAMMIEAVTV